MASRRASAAPEDTPPGSPKEDAFLTYPSATKHVEDERTPLPFWRRHPLRTTGFAALVVVIVILAVVLPVKLTDKDSGDGSQNGTPNTSSPGTGAGNGLDTPPIGVLPKPKDPDNDDLESDPDSDEAELPEPFDFLPDGTPIVRLPSGTFTGAHDAQNNLTFFRRIPFAAPPVGPLRFRAPQPFPPLPSSEVYDSDQSMPDCPQRDPGKAPYEGKEDCLYLGVYARPWEPRKMPKRPVVVYFYSGGFVQGGVDKPLPQTWPVMNVSGVVDYVAVHLNYRMNVFGFLPVKEEEEGDLNVGLLDQQAALKWVRGNIAAFGGDPGDVTIWGQSAGAGSVLAHTIANGGETHPRLFKNAIAASPFWPRVYEYDSDEAQSLYTRTLELTNCKDLACLKKAPMKDLIDASVKIRFSKRYTTSTYSWAPVLDGDFLRESLSSALHAKHINAHRIMSIFNHREGVYFTPEKLTLAGFAKWFDDYLPRLSSETKTKALELYPAVHADYKTSHERAAMIYGDITVACPAYWAAKAANVGFVIEYTILPATHGSDTGYWSRPTKLQEEEKGLYTQFAGAFAGFVMGEDPNWFGEQEESGRVRSGWPRVENREVGVIRTDGAGISKVGGLEERCEFWREVDEEVIKV